METGWKQDVRKRAEERAEQENRNFFRKRTR